MNLFIFVLSITCGFDLQKQIVSLISKTYIQGSSPEELLGQLRNFVLKNEDTKRQIHTKSFPVIRTQRIILTTFDNVKIHAYLLVPREITYNTTAAVILHGIGCNREEFIENYKLYDVVDTFNIILLVPDYRDFGDSEGTFSVEGCDYDIDVCCNFMREVLSVDQINLIGFSFGTATALNYVKKIASNKRCGSVNNNRKLSISMIEDVLRKESCYNYMASNAFYNSGVKVALLGSFSSISNVLKYDLQIFDWIKKSIRYILDLVNEHFNYDNTDAIKYINPKDVLLVHGTNDTDLLVWHSEELERISGAKCMYTNDNHGGLLLNESVWDRMLTFFNGN